MRRTLERFAVLVDRAVLDVSVENSACSAGSSHSWTVMRRPSRRNARHPLGGILAEGTGAKDPGFLGFKYHKAILCCYAFQRVGASVMAARDRAR